MKQNVSRPRSYCFPSQFTFRILEQLRAGENFSCTENEINIVNVSHYLSASRSPQQFYSANE